MRRREAVQTRRVLKLRDMLNRTGLYSILPMAPEAPQMPGLPVGPTRVEAALIKHATALRSALEPFDSG